MAGYMPRPATVDWRTPPEVVELLHVLWEGGPDLDPCASEGCPDEELIGKANHFGPAAGCEDGLLVPWRGRVFVNPPFADLASWLGKAAASHRLLGTEVVFLLPARTDTAYWHEQVATADLVVFWRGRLKFVGAPAAAPFPVALAYWGHRPWEFHRTFAGRGMVVAP